MPKIGFLSLGLIPYLFVGFSALAGAPPKQTPELLAAGKKAYQSNCVACHGDKGDGAGTTGKMLKPPPRNFISDKFKQGDAPDAVFKTITDGMPGTMMMGYKQLSEKERWGLVYYVKAFKK